MKASVSSGTCVLVSTVDAHTHTQGTPLQCNNVLELTVAGNDANVQIQSSLATPGCDVVINGRRVVARSRSHNSLESRDAETPSIEGAVRKHLVRAPMVNRDRCRAISLEQLKATELRRWSHRDCSSQCLVSQNGQLGSTYSPL